MNISFDRAAEFYDQTRGFPPGIGEQVAASLVEFAKLTPAQHILEVGVGTGRIMRPLSAALGSGHHLVGVDISRKMMERLLATQPAGIPPAALVEADGMDLPFPARTFDACVLVHVLHLVRDWRALLKGLEGIIRPGGRIISGGNDHPSESSGEQINLKFREIAKAHGVSMERQGLTSPDDLLNHLPSHIHGSEVIAATWTVNRAPRTALQSIAERHFSSSWQIPDDLYPNLYAEIEAWAKSQWPDLDQPIPEQRGFKWTKLEFT